MAIVYGGETDYILCVMSEGGSSSAITTIQKISATVYDYLNGTNYAKEVENEEETGGMTKASGSEAPDNKDEEFAEENDAWEGDTEATGDWDLDWEPELSSPYMSDSKEKSAEKPGGQE